MDEPERGFKPATEEDVLATVRRVMEEMQGPKILMGPETYDKVRHEADFLRIYSSIHVPEGKAYILNESALEYPEPLTTEPLMRGLMWPVLVNPASAVIIDGI